MWIEKLKNRKGETIAEVLVAALVVVLGVLLFAMMVQSSFRIISNSEDKMLKIYDAESTAEMTGGTPVHSGISVTFDFSPNGHSYGGLIISGDTAREADLYGIEGENLYSYRTKEKKS